MHCTNEQVEKYIQQAIYPLKKFLHNKTLYKYKLILKNENSEVINIFTIEFEQLHKAPTDFNYTSFEQFTWDFFSYLEMLIYPDYDLEKTFEISIDILEDVENEKDKEKASNKILGKDWEIINYDNLDIFNRRILKSMNLLNDGLSAPICQIYIENRKKEK